MKKAPVDFGAQPLGMDGKDFTYRKSVIFEAVPANIEILWDSDSYFVDCGAFGEVATEAVREKAEVDAIVEKIWAKYDLDRSGELDKQEARVFLKEFFG